MDLFKDLKIFASFGNTIKVLNIAINFVRMLSLIFLIGQLIVIFKDAKQADNEN